MESLKIYEKINSKESNVHFGISKMKDIYTKRKGNRDVPHRHNYYTILVIKNGKGIHKIDFNTYDIGESQIFFVSPNQVHQLIEDTATEGFSIVFSNQFLIKNNISISFVENLNLFQNYGQNPPLIPNKNQFNSIVNFSNEIYNLYNSDANMKFLSIGAFLKLLLIQCNNICTLHPIDPDGNIPTGKIVKDFKTEVELNYKKEHSTSFYADRLHISPDYLNRKIKSKIGKTAKEYIQTKIIIEAKRLLYFTDMTNKEIAYELGFNEPANFSAFFKKNTNYSPSQFKKIELGN